MIWRLLYNLLLHLLLPLLLWQLYRPKKGAPGFGKRWAEHLGLIPKSRAPFDLWIHAVSVGESNAAIPLIKQLLEQNPELKILVTTTTATGFERIQSQLGSQVTHRYCPLDLPLSVWLFLHRTQPRCLMIMETELWPNLLQLCHRKQIPIILANARMSARSAKRYSKLSGFSRPLFSKLSAVLAQYPADAQRFIALGVEASKVQVTGSMKFDLKPDEQVRAKGEQLRNELGKARPVIIAASTRDGEEALLLPIFRELLSRHPDTLLIIVPRHPQRFDEVYQLCLSQKFTTARRSLNEPVTSQTQIYLGDTMGELLTLYAASDIAFIGGSLVPLGGQNMLEPAALGLPCLIGPSSFNFADITRMLSECGALKQCADPQQLGESLDELLTHPGQQQAMSRAALQVMEENRGAVARTCSQLTPFIARQMEKSQ